jgi:type IV pilus assembly protein PilM
LFEDKPVFGLDIGHGTVRVMQLQPGKHRPKVIGYGEMAFDQSCVVDGVIIKHQELAASVQKLFQHSLIGDITTRRVVLSVPTSRAFVRSAELPELSETELKQAVGTEVEQYIPAAAESLYVDYSSVQTKDNKWAVFIVAMPRKVVDSYLLLCELLGLEPVVVQTSSSAGAHLFARDEQSNLPSVLVDFGSHSADITVYDKNPTVSGTVACGGDQITKLIQDALDVTEREAVIVKTKYGLGYSKKQKQIEAALAPTLDQLIKEIQRSVRYYDERSRSKHKISQVVIMGGGANMPGLADHLTSALRIPARALDPSNFVSFGRLQPIHLNEKMSYVTVTGLAFVNPREAL